MQCVVKHLGSILLSTETNTTVYIGLERDVIYPSYACFVKTFPHATTCMQKMFASAQEAKIKEIERAFGILQARFHILTSGCRLWNRLAMLHNLIIDYEMKNNVDSTYITEACYTPEHPFRLFLGMC